MLCMVFPSLSLTSPARDMVIDIASSHKKKYRIHTHNYIKEHYITSCIKLLLTALNITVTSYRTQKHMTDKQYMDRNTLLCSGGEIGATGMTISILHLHHLYTNN